MKRSFSVIALVLALLLMLPTIPVFATEGETAAQHPQPRIKSVALKFESTIYMRFKMYLGDDVEASNTDGYGMIFWKEKPADGNYNYDNAKALEAEGKAKIITSSTDDTYNGQSVKAFIFSVEVAEMADVFYAQGYVKYGEDYIYSTKTIAYSVQSYAAEILYGTTEYPETLKDMIKAMLDFGAKAQIYFDHNTDNLANAIVANGVTQQADGTYLISTAAGLQWFNDQINNHNNSFGGKTIKLACDIDMKNAEWLPAGQNYTLDYAALGYADTTEFHGVFDGAGHTISNIKIGMSAENVDALDKDNSGETSDHAIHSVGFIGYSAGGTVKNLTISNATVTGFHNVGTILGYGDVDTVIDNCHVVGSTVTGSHLTDDQCGDKVGGLVGFYNNGSKSITNCSVKDTTITAARDAAKVIGYATGTDGLSGLSAENVRVEKNETGCNHSRHGQVSEDALVGDATTAGHTLPIAKDDEGNYLIYNAQELARALDNTDNNPSYARNIILMADIDGSAWTAISGSTNYPAVTINGNGHKITNLADSLFSDLPARDYIFTNLTFEQVNIIADTAASRGVIVGQANSNGGGSYTITNCKIDGGSITATKSGAYVGGFIGFIAGYPEVKFTNCDVNNVTLSSACEATGAFIGHSYAVVTMKNCNVKGNTSVTCAEDRTGKDAKAGYFIGTVCVKSLSLNDCAVDSTVNLSNTGATPAANGLIGRLADGGKLYVNGATPVSTAEELASALNNFTNGVTVKVVLLNDIDMSAWTALTGGTNHADIVLDGNGHKLMRMKTCLFSSLPAKEYKFKNLTFTNVEISDNTEGGVGVVVGSAQANGGGIYSFTDCHITGGTVAKEANNDTDGRYIGGFIGLVEGDESGSADITFTRCTVSDVTFKGFKAIGAFIGHTYGSVTMKNCAVNGNTSVTCTEDRKGSGAKAGYFIGTVNMRKTSLNNCTVADTASLKNTNATPLAGGMVGRCLGELYIDDGKYIANGVILKNGEYLISNANGLKYCAETFTKSDTTINKVFKLTANIDMIGVTWTPWCNEDQYFNGLFDGQNHTISNLTITDDHTADDGHAVGFIGRLGSTTGLQNVTFDNANVSGHHYVAVAVGYNEYGTVNSVNVTNSSVTATHANAAQCGDKAGAVVGMCGASASDGAVNNCSATKCTVKAARDAGQIVGAAKTAQVSNCTATNVEVSEVENSTCNDDSHGMNINKAVIGRIL